MTATANSGLDRMTGSRSRSPIIVGVDGSERDLPALRWAAQESARVGNRLLLVHAVDRGPAPNRSRRTAEAHAQNVIAAARRHLDDLPTGDKLPAAEAAIVSGSPAKVLTHVAGEHLVVVGTHGPRRHARAFSRRISIAAAARASGPAAVVPSGWNPGREVDGPIVVGVNAPHPSRAPLRFAFSHAARQQVPLIAVYAWTSRGVSGGPGSPLRDVVVSSNSQAVEAARSLEFALAPYRDRYPSLDIRTDPHHGHRAAAILQAAKGSQLVVLGRRGITALGGFPVRSVTRSILHQSDCPIAIIPDAWAT